MPLEVHGLGFEALIHTMQLKSFIRISYNEWFSNLCSLTISHRLFNRCFCLFIQADVIVNTTDKSLRRLQSGQISKSILFAAGDELSKECVKKYSKGVGYSEVAVTPSFQLKLCKKIYHGGIPTYNGTLEVRLQEITLQMYLVICIYDLHKKILP